MENNQTPLNQTHFRYLSTAEIENPFNYINGFCERETRIHHFREDMQDLIRTAFSYKEVYPLDRVPNFGYDQQSFIKVMECAFVVYHSHIALEPSGESHAHHYHSLSKEERNDIRQFLADFFAYRTLDEWRVFMDDVLIHAHKEGGVGYFEYEQTPFATMDFVGKMAEAIFFIYEIGPRDQIPVKDKKDEDHGQIDELGDNGFNTEQIDKSAGINPLPGRVLSERFLEAVHDYFVMIDPRFVNRAIRHLLLTYLRNGFETGFGREQMLVELMYPLQQLFELFDLAEQDTADWSNSRIGCDFVN